MTYRCANYDDAGGEWSTDFTDVDVADSAKENRLGKLLAEGYAVAIGIKEDEEIKISKVVEVLPGVLIVSGTFGRDVQFVQHCICMD